MKRTAALLLALVLASAIAAPASAATPTVTLSSQGWWRAAGIAVPSAVGQHIHLDATVPADGPLVNGIVDVPVKVTLHDFPARTAWLRVQEASESGQTERFKQDIALGPCADCSVNLTVRLDFSKWKTGRSEMRWTVNVADADPDTSGSQRMYQSTGWQVCVRSCSPSYRSGPWIEARGWYQGRGYANARLVSGLETVRSGGTIKVALKPGSGGKATKLSGIYLDPDMHAGNAGIVVRQSNGSFSGSVTLPTLASGPHRLVLVSSDGLNAGVQVIPLVVP